MFELRLLVPEDSVEIVSGLSENDTVALSATTTHELTNGLAVKAVE